MVSAVPSTVGVGLKTRRYDMKPAAQQLLHSAQAHPTQLKVTSTKSGSVLATCIFSVCRLELQLSLFVVVSAHSETGSSVGKKKIRIHDAESPPKLSKWAILLLRGTEQNSLFAFDFSYNYTNREQR